MFACCHARRLQPIETVSFTSMHTLTHKYRLDSQHAWSRHKHPRAPLSTGQGKHNHLLVLLCSNHREGNDTVRGRGFMYKTSLLTGLCTCRASAFSCTLHCCCLGRMGGISHVGCGRVVWMGWSAAAPTTGTAPAGRCCPPIVGVPGPCCCWHAHIFELCRRCCCGCDRGLSRWWLLAACAPAN